MSSTDQTNQPGFRREFGRAGHYAKDTLGGFRTFILRGNVVDLAIGIVIGAAFTSVVNGFVSGIITPLIPVSKNGGLSTYVLDIPHTYIKLGIGTFINAVISFLIVAFILYFFVVRPVNTLMSRYKPAPPATTRDCPYCLQSIPLQATRCMYCTSPVPPANAPANAQVGTQSGQQRT
jgi:large conductance mechanosensitive channel